MILRDLQAIVHGNVTLIKWNDEAEDFTTLYSTTHFAMKYVPEYFHDMEVIGIRPVTNNDGQLAIHIEVEE